MFKRQNGFRRWNFWGAESWLTWLLALRDESPKLRGSSGIHQLWGEDFIHHTGQAIIYGVYAQLAPQVRCHTAHVRKNTNFSLKYCVAVADFFVSVPYPFDWSFASLPQNQISSLSKKKKNQISSQPKQARPLIIVWNYCRQYSFKT